MDNTNKEIVSFWRDSLLFDLELLHARYITHAFSRHAHDEFAIGVIYLGTQALTYRQSDRLLMPAGSIAAINPGEVHTGYAENPEEGWTYRMLYPTPELLQHLTSEMTGRETLPFFPSPVIFDPLLANQIYQMHCALESPHTPAIEQETHLVSVLSRLIVRHADSRLEFKPAQPTESRLQIIRDYLRANYRDNVSLTELSELTGLSKFYVCRVFREAIGLPPHAYLNLVRIHQAKRLLKKGLSVSQVAVDVGFFDQTHFTKRFKAVLGITPNQYAKGNVRSTTRTY